MTRVLVPAVIGARLAYAVIRFVLLPATAKANYPAALWARFRWRWLTRNLGLAYLDQHRKAIQVVPFGTSVSVRPADTSQSARLRFPACRIRPDAFGLVASVKTVPKTGRAEFEACAPWIADAWRCVRVQVSQPKPSRLIVRGLKIDPLTLPLSMADAPPGVYSSEYPAESNDSLSLLGRRSGRRRSGLGESNDSVPIHPNIPLRLYLGMDEWGNHRYLPLPGLTGITCGGLPGYGKTAFVLSLLCQLAGLPVQFVFIDGKGGGDYADWTDRAWISTGDELPAAAAALEDAHALMRSRFGTVLELTGHRNAWRTGPTPAFPLIVTVIDECHTFMDLDAVKGQRDAEANVRACRTMAGQLVRKGRSVLMLTILITQKQTSDAIPTAIRDNCGFGVSFATRTTDAAVAALGEQIRSAPSFCPTTLTERPAYVGACTASLPTGLDPFVRLRVPEVTEEAAAARAAETACKRLDPRAIPVPAAVAESPVLAATS